MSRSLHHLLEVPQHRPLVARWIYDAFWTDKEGYDAAYIERRLAEASDRKRIPLALVSLDEGVPAGTASLIVDDYSARPHLTPWLAAVYVVPAFRGRGHATALCRRVLHEARDLGCETVYLTTEIPDFYRRLGADVYETLAEDFWIMRVSTDSP